MKIIQVEGWAVTMELAEPYTIAYERVEVATNIFLRVESSSGVIGYGCAAPDEHVTGETPESVLAALDDIVTPSIKGSDPLRPVMLLERLKPLLRSQPSVLAAVDMALFDILGKVCNLPLWRLLGGFRDRIRTSVTIGILPEKETVERARELVARGFKCLKLKGGIDVESDISRVLQVREAVGREIELRFDANQGFSVEDSLMFVEKTRKARLELFEQPTPKGQPEMLRLQINSVARAAGLEVMVGCMDEAALGISAGLHFALARPNVVYADLDGHMGLLGDPSAGVVILRNGSLFPNNNPGLGFNMA